MAAAPARRVVAFVDGSCLENPGPGGWAVVMQEGAETREWSSSSATATTNNRMELQAAVSAVQEGLALGLQHGELVVTTDSRYVFMGITRWIRAWKRNGWKTASGTEVRNCDLWRALDAEASALRPLWAWVPGHSARTPAEHARADEMARAAARASRPG